jgi:hypothetical protein
MTLQRALGALCAIVIALVTHVASADDRRAVVIYAEGDDSKALAGEIARDLPDGLSARDGSSVSGALEKRKLKNKLGASLANKKDRPKAIDALADAASASDVAAVVAVSSKKPAKGPKSVTIVIVKGGSRDPDVETAANDAGDRKAVVTKSLAPLAPAPKTAPEPTPTATPTASPEPTSTEPKEVPPTEPAAADDDRAGFARATVIAYAGVLSGSRFFEYNQSLSPSLRDYQLYAAFHFTAGGELYPLARTRIPVARDLGIEVRWSRAIGLDSRIPNGPKVGTTWDRFYIGGRARLRLGKSETPPQLGFSVGYGRWVFAFDDAGNPVAATDPAERQHQLLFGVDARLPIAKHVALHGGVAGGPSFVDDPISLRFRHTTAGEVVFKVGVAFPIVRHLEVRATIAYDRFFFAFNSKRGDAFVAGGALDHNLFGTLELGAWF